MYFLIIFSTVTFFTYRLARDYKGKTCGQILQLQESELKMKPNSSLQELKQMLMNPQSKFRGNYFSKFCVLKIYARKYCDSYLHFMDILVSNDACKNNIQL